MTPPNGVRQLRHNGGIERDVFARVRHAEGDVPSLVLSRWAFGYDGHSWTCPRVARLIESQFGVAYHPGHVWKVLTSLGLRRS
jgi:transposase